MPIYEFYCEDCHRVLRFLARRVDTTSRPACPRCGRRRLPRRPSTFAVARGLSEPTAAPGDDLDDAQLERAMAQFAAEAEGLDDDDPRQAARLMRQLYETLGLGEHPGVEEALARMEAGEDPEQVEADLGDVLDAEPGETGGSRLRRLRRRVLPPTVDPKLYEM
jgi:putative FmdB family regulatory protein